MASRPSARRAAAALNGERASARATETGPRRNGAGGSAAKRAAVGERRDELVIVRGGHEHGSGLALAVVAERTFAWPHNVRRLRIQSERNPNHAYRLPAVCAANC
jgi:hypothetical protein